MDLLKYNVFGLIPLQLFNFGIGVLINSNVESSGTPIGLFTNLICRFSLVTIFLPPKGILTKYNKLLTIVNVNFS